MVPNSEAPSHHLPPLQRTWTSKPETDPSWRFWVSVTPALAQPLLSHRVSFNLPCPSATESREEIHPELLSSSQVDSGNSLLPSHIPPPNPRRHGLCGTQPSGPLQPPYLTIRPACGPSAWLGCSSLWFPLLPPHSSGTSRVWPHSLEGWHLSFPSPFTHKCSWPNSHTGTCSTCPPHSPRICLFKASGPGEGWIQTVDPGGGNDNLLHYSCLKNPMNCGRPQSTGWQRIGHDWWTKHTHLAVKTDNPSVFKVASSQLWMLAFKWTELGLNSVHTPNQLGQVIRFRSSEPHFPHLCKVDVKTYSTRLVQSQWEHKWNKG